MIFSLESVASSRVLAPRGTQRASLKSRFCTITEECLHSLMNAPFVVLNFAIYMKEKYFCSLRRVLFVASSK